MNIVKYTRIKWRTHENGTRRLLAVIAKGDGNIASAMLTRIHNNTDIKTKTTIPQRLHGQHLQRNFKRRYKPNGTPHKAR